MKNLLSYKNQVIVENEGILYGFSHRKIIATHDIEKDSTYIYSKNLETIENGKFLDLFSSFVKDLKSACN